MRKYNKCYIEVKKTQAYNTDIPSNNNIDLDNNNKRRIPNELSMNHRQQSDKKNNEIHENKTGKR